MKKRNLLLWGLVFIPLHFAMSAFTPDWNSIDSRETPEWYTDAKFGIFIHWGLFSVPAWGPIDTESIYDKYAEWYWYKLMDKNSPVNAQFSKFHSRQYGEDFQYQDFAGMFKAELFEPRAWANMIKASGAKYVVLTSKHHEGFCLWPSDQAWNWNAMDVGPHRDLAGDLSAAVKEAGLHMGFYYSLYEWFNPLYRENVEAYVDQHMIPQMKDLINRYEPDVFWTDGEWDHTSDTWKATEFLAWLFNESPVKETVAVNDRWGSETRAKHGGFYTTEYNLVHDKEITGGMDHAWEECRGIGTSFGYNRMEDLENYSSSRELIHILIEKVSRGGNLLLNIGPTADGRIPVIMQQRLADIGAWLRVNGEAIYGTERWDGATGIENHSLAFTRKGSDLYLFVLDPVKKPSIKVPLGNLHPRSVELLGSSVPLQWSSEEGMILLDFPEFSLGQQPCDYAWVLKLENALL